MTPIPEAFRSNPQFIEVWREEFLMTAREAYIHCANRMSRRTSLVGDLGRISVPTLIVCGEHDVPFVEPSRQMHERIPGSRLEIIPRAGHGPQMETPAEFNRVLSEFLSRVQETVSA